MKLTGKGEKSIIVIKKLLIITALGTIMLGSMSFIDSCCHIPGFHTTTTGAICLTVGTIIDTPNGPVPVEQLHEGMIVWTMNESGNRVAATIIETSETSVPSTHQVVVVTLSDGRSVTASLAHPTAEGRALGDYCVGDTIDGAIVVDMNYMTYNGNATYDLLPDSSTGLYWANGILLKSTLAR